MLECFVFKLAFESPEQPTRFVFAALSEKQTEETVEKPFEKIQPGRNEI